FTPEERAGFQGAIDAHRVASVDMVWLGESYTRLFRMGAYPPLRGTFLTLSMFTLIFHFPVHRNLPVVPPLPVQMFGRESWERERRVHAVAAAGGSCARAW